MCYDDGKNNEGDDEMSEETIECRADLCGREAHLEGKDWYFCKCGWSGSSYDEVAVLTAEVKRLREDIEGYQAIWNYLDPKGYAWDEEEFVALIKEHGFETGDEQE